MSKRARQRLSPSQEVRPSTTWAKIWKTAAVVGPVFVALFGFLQNGDTVVGNAAKLTSWLRDDAHFTGTWWNGEGDVIDDGTEAATPEDVVWISLTSTSGRLAGTVHSPKLCDYLPRPYALFEGTNSMFGASGRAFDAVKGKDTTLDRFRLKLQSDGELLVLEGDEDGPVFKKTVTLHRIAAEAKDRLEGVGALCGNLMSTVRALKAPKRP